MTEEWKKCVCPNGCAEWAQCGDCPVQCSETHEPLSPRESFIAAGGKLVYKTVDSVELDVPYLDDEVEYTWDSPDILFGKATIKMSGMSAEGLHLQCDYLMKLIHETVEMFNERMDFFAKIVFDINRGISDAMRAHTTATHPEFIDRIIADQVAKKAKMKKDMDDKVAAITPEQKESIQKMMDTKTNLS